MPSGARKTMNMGNKLVIDLEDFRKDKSEGSIYHSWQANIAMAFKDEAYRTDPVEFGDENRAQYLHVVAHQAAKNFLDLLCYKPKYISDLNDIDTSTKEGKYLMAALAIITTECRINKTPYEVLDELTILRDKMYESTE